MYLVCGSEIIFSDPDLALALISDLVPDKDSKSGKLL